MISVYKFENFNAYKVDARVLTKQGMPNKPVNYSFIQVYSRRSSNHIIVPIPKNIEVVTDSDISYIGNINITSLLNTVTDFTFNDKVYIHSNCTIPRAKVTQKYTRVLRPEKADICVVPNLVKKDTYNISIFINRNKNKIYILENTSEYISRKFVYYTSEKCLNFNLGSSILDINPSLKGTLIKKTPYFYSNKNNDFSMENWWDFLESTLLYYGPVIYLNNNESWITDLLYNKLHDVITEDKLLATLGDFTNEFTKEVYDNLKEMLKSSDSNVVGLGLKAVAEMDYRKYRNTAIHLLCNCGTRWIKNEMRSSSNVKYMLNYLGLWRSARENYTDVITQEDFALMQKVVSDDFNNRIEYTKDAFNSRFPFANIDLSYQFEISPKLEEDNTLETKDNEDIELDNNSDDDI